MARNSIAPGPIVCEACGAKLRGDRARCPRCRARIVAADPIAIAARSRKLQAIGVSLIAAAVVLVAGIGTFAPAAGRDKAVRGTSDPLLARRTPARAAAASAPDAPAERPFTEPAGAAYESYQAGDYESALEHFQEAIKRNPRDAEALSNLGQVLVRLGRTPEALPFFDRAIELNPDRWAYQFNRARAAGLLGRWDESIAGYRRAQGLFPEDYVTTFNLALALHKSGDEEAAVTEYRKAIGFAPQDASFRRALAISLDKLHKGPEAAAAYEEYLKLSPQAEDADNVKARIALLTGAPPVAASGPAPPGSPAGR